MASPNDGKLPGPVTLADGSQAVTRVTNPGQGLDFFAVVERMSGGQPTGAPRASAGCGFIHTRQHPPETIQGFLDSAAQRLTGGGQPEAERQIVQNMRTACDGLNVPTRLPGSIAP